MLTSAPWLATLALAAATAQAAPAPAQVIIIRHGEKPATGNQLAPQGCARAYALPDFFQNDPTVMEFGDPAAIYAMRPGQDTADPDSSIRPIQTIAPTADHFKLPLRDGYTRLEFSPIVNEILGSADYAGKTVLIAWEHKVIPDLAEAFGVKIDSGTKKWPGNVFDQAWVIRFHLSGKDNLKADLTIIPEHALSTDNPQGGDDWSAGPSSADPATLSPAIAQECANNDAVNKLVVEWANPPLPPTVFGN